MSHQLSSDRDFIASAKANRTAWRAAPTVLVAEDHTLVRQMVRTVLEDAGYQVIEARDGTEARCLIAQHAGEIDLLIVDAVMPGASGREVLAFVREHCSDLPVILSSGHAAHDLEPGFASMVELLPKPYDTAQLLEKVAAALAR